MGERYTITGWAWGTFTNDQGTQQPYANLFVTSPVQDNPSAGYHAVGYKAEKLRCVSPDVWVKAGLVVGDDAILIFDRRGRVSYAEHIERQEEG